MNLNKLSNTKNPYQGSYKKVLCICSAGLLRSPTMAYVLSQEPFNFNTRAAGMDEEFALISVDDYIVNWAEEIVFAEQDHYDEFVERFGAPTVYKILDIPDKYEYRNPELVKLIKDAYEYLD